METRKFRPHLLLTFAVLHLCFLAVEARAQQSISWNKDANSLVLNLGELTKLSEILPPWKIRQITLPADQEIRSKAVRVDNKVKLSCLEWLRKFIRKDELPADLDNHLIAMKNWGLIRKESEQKRLCDVFLLRYKKPPYVVHIQESPYNVVLAVSDERLAKSPRSDHKGLVIETAATILNDTLKHDPNSKNLDVRVYQVGADDHKISSVTWGIDSLVSKDSSGRRALDLVKAGVIGTTGVRAETDGRFVKLEIIKCPGAVKAAFFDPYVERFKPKTNDEPGK